MTPARGVAGYSAAPPPSAGVTAPAVAVQGGLLESPEQGEGDQGQDGQQDAMAQYPMPAATPVAAAQRSQAQEAATCLSS